MFEDRDNIIAELVSGVMEGEGDSDRHLMTLFSIVLSSRGTNVLELGVRDGTTTLPLLYSTYLNGGTLTSVDKVKRSFQVPEYAENSWDYIESDAIEFLEKYDGEKFDIVYVDDWHSYDHVYKELNYLDKMVGPSSLIILHDLMYGNTEPFYHTDLTVNEGQWAKGGPYRAVAELDLNFWEWATIPWNNGLTILRKKYSSKYHTK